MWKVKLSDVTNNEVVKIDVYNKLVKRNNAIDTSQLAKKQIMILRSMRLKVQNLVLLAWLLLMLLGMRYPTLKADSKVRDNFC